MSPCEGALGGYLPQQSAYHESRDEPKQYKASFGKGSTREGRQVLRSPVGVLVSVSYPLLLDSNKCANRLCPDLSACCVSAAGHSAMDIC